MTSDGRYLWWAPRTLLRDQSFVYLRRTTYRQKLNTRPRLPRWFFSWIGRVIRRDHSYVVGWAEGNWLDPAAYWADMFTIVLPDARSARAEYDWVCGLPEVKAAVLAERGWSKARRETYRDYMKS